MCRVHLQHSGGVGGGTPQRAGSVGSQEISYSLPLSDGWAWSSCSRWYWWWWWWSSSWWWWSKISCLCHNFSSAEHTSVQGNVLKLEWDVSEEMSSFKCGKLPEFGCVFVFCICVWNTLKWVKERVHWSAANSLNLEANSRSSIRDCRGQMSQLGMKRSQNKFLFSKLEKLRGKYFWKLQDLPFISWTMSMSLSMLLLTWRSVY